MAINLGSLQKQLMPGINKIFGMEYNEYPLQYKELFKEERSDKYFEEDVGMFGFGLAVKKPDGESYSYGSAAEGFIKRYVHDEYGLGFIITRNAVEDNQYMPLVERYTKALAFSMRQTLENVGANVFNRAVDTNYVGADGLPLLSTAHLNAKGGTQANRPVSGTDLSELSLEQAIIACMAFTDDAGLKISIMPQKLAVHRTEIFNAERILKSNLQNDTALNAMNALKSKGVLPGGVVVNQYFNDPDQWFLLTNCQNGLRHFVRRGIELSNDTPDFDTENMKTKISFRGCFGWTDFKGVYGNPGG